MEHHKGLTLKYEKRKVLEGHNFVIGCDEVGRGCLAGPVVAAAVLLPIAGEKFKVKSYQGITDSKLLSAKQREKFDGVIRQHALGLGIGVVSHSVIDKINIHQASLLAMRKAVENLMSSVSSETKNKIFVRQLVNSEDPVNVLIALDGKFIIPKFNMKQEAMVDGDAKILSIAAASIVAKVYRDNLMRKAHKKYPLYRFDEHKGYATLHHRNAIKKVGLSPLHRKSFCRGYV